MDCKNCGKKMTEDTKFCDSCGALNVEIKEEPPKVSDDTAAAITVNEVLDRDGPDNNQEINKDILKDNRETNEDILKDNQETNKDILKDNRETNEDILKDNQETNKDILKDNQETNKDISKSNQDTIMDITNNQVPNKDIPKSNETQNNKAVFILAYLGILFFLPLVFCPDSKVGKFHANQGLVLLITSIVGETAYYILSSILPWRLEGTLSLVSTVWSLAVFALMIIGMINANKGEQKPLPVIGSIQILK